jgi:chemotaxis family two-component system sensor kinase Cph1
MSQTAGKILDEVKVDLAGRNILWEVGILPDVRGAPSILRLVASNLLSNALKYSRLRDPAMINVGSISDEPQDCILGSRKWRGADIQYFDKRLGVFQRLHSAEEFEGTDMDSPA